MADSPILGLYDTLLTQRLNEQVDQWRAAGHVVHVDGIDEADAAHLLGRYIGEAAARALAALRGTDAQVEFANQLLRTFADPELVHAGPGKLLAITAGEPGAQPPVRPSTALAEAALLTNAREDPHLAHELAAELASANGVDLLCAFVKWSGLRILEQRMEQLQRRGVPLRVITTTYMGATERRALDRLVNDFGAQVKISYEQNSTRLHAKAWLLRRDTGFDTAYVGSSNLSAAALLDGLEWNVRLSAVTTPRLLEKFRATFDSYWDRTEFELYDPAEHAQRLDEALAVTTSTKRRLIDVPALVPHPYPHQREMLEDLDLERTAHDRHRNLLVAATGTGKTVTAAFDYRNLQQRLGRLPSLLFVAHRREILDQALHTYRQVLARPTFGELHVGDDRTREWHHVFASVQSLHRNIADLAPEHFDVVVIDEFHHAHAPTYRRILDHLRPQELLGLTATPERADGTWVQDEFFDRHISAELRLWDALHADLLCPFHYFGINDETDLTRLEWVRGAYDSDALDAAYTGNKDRARLVFNAVRDKVSDLGAVRGLGFCVSVQHARFMAEFFTSHGVLSRAVDGTTSVDQRREALDDLRAGRVTFLFAVDLFNEGLDIPDINTILMLRPTQSATVFLQQLGRGLRRTPEKDVLTVLDFVGQHRAEFRLENRFQALTGLFRGRLEDDVAKDFPRLPPGCQVVLDRIAKERLLSSLQEHLSVKAAVLVQELRRYAQPKLADYLEASGRDIVDVYRRERYWTLLLRRSGLLPGEGSELEHTVGRRLRAFLHVDDEPRAAAYAQLATASAPYADLSPVEQAFARMLVFSIWRDGDDFADYDEALSRLRSERYVRDELRQIVAYTADRPRRVAKPLTEALSQVPLTVNARYSTDEILAALGWAELGRRVPAHMQSGVAWAPATQCDALLVTLRKNEKEFSPQTMYRDYALTPELFHWESQNSTSGTSSVGVRYRHHAQLGSHILLFTRESKSTEAGHPEPYVFHGTAQYVDHRGEKPMAVTWRLDEPMPEELFRRAAVAA
ncbi:helicase [Catellatospora sp. TT07R-123]|uniref:DUF3427 domain-containing protein n=1 Tax=Catellatospora sp. TT07R-123 TaxID=2733863 RepID=UPI001B290005|nr:DEAD/DEAH box helicase [Catellatospora sp. TT07R-123]GHJ48983.1 helicase [Catellatospora sp. TT07R-123]